MTVIDSRWGIDQGQQLILPLLPKKNCFRILNFNLTDLFPFDQKLDIIKELPDEMETPSKKDCFGNLSVNFKEPAPSAQRPIRVRADEKESVLSNKRVKLEVLSQFHDRVIVLSSGALYKGHVKDNLPEGRGKSWEPSTNLPIYKGEWAKGLPHGEGEQYSTSEESTTYVEFRGKWIHGRFSEGSQFHPDGLLRFQGIWDRTAVDRYQGFLHPEHNLIFDQAIHERNPLLVKPQAIRPTSVKTQVVFNSVESSFLPR
jgi:hypothetical protein